MQVNVKNMISQYRNHQLVNAVCLFLKRNRCYAGARKMFFPTQTCAVNIHFVRNAGGYIGQKQFTKQNILVVQYALSHGLLVKTLLPPRKKTGTSMGQILAQI